jgi:glycosyltransferase involved in cell wall biosynthesis
MVWDCVSMTHDNEPGHREMRVTQFMRKPVSSAYSMETVYADIRKHLPADIAVQLHMCRFPSRGIVGRLRDAWTARRHQADVNHVTGDVHYLTYFLNPRRCVVTMHDCVALDRQTGLRRWLLWLLWYWLPERRCQLIITVSHASKERLLRYLRCPADKIHVIHNPVGQDYRPAPKQFNQVRPRILIVGTAPNKNLERMAEALQGLACEVVVIGRMRPSQVEAFRQAGVAFVNHVDLSREAVVDCYVDCDMLAFASTYEGFGLPIVEAHAVGRPVVTSNIHSMPEVAGGAACLVDPFNVASIRAGILEVIENREYRQSLVQKGFLNVNRFQVQHVAGHYADVYRQLGTRQDLHR